jgi:histidinol phosphatase-like enzyme (inositol monophosphatase family)
VNVPPSAPDLAARLEFAVRTARRAGAIAQQYFQTELSVEMKGDGSPITIADRRAEQELREQLRAAYPDDAVLGEEFGETPGTSGWRWILDPIDGTRSFIHGVPLWGVLIGGEDRGEAVLGVAYLPALDELVYAARGHGCWWRPAGHPADAPPWRAQVSPVARLAEGLLLTTSLDYYYQTGRVDVLERLIRAGKTRGWSDCYAHMLVATGRAEAVVEPVMSIWDSAPFLPILREAGGTFTDWEGTPTIAADTAVSTNGRVYEEVLRLLRP